MIKLHYSQEKNCIYDHVLFFTCKCYFYTQLQSERYAKQATNLRLLLFYFFCKKAGKLFAALTPYFFTGIIPILS